LSDPELAKKMGERGRQRVVNEFGWEKITGGFREAIGKYESKI